MSRNKLHQIPALSGDAQNAPVERLHTSAADKVLVYLRTNGKHQVLTFLNLSKDIVHVQINDERVNGELREIFSKAINDFTNNKNFEMQPWSYLVFEK